METLQRTANRGSVSTGYDIDNSLKLEDDNTENLYRALNGSTSTTKFTISMWAKRTEINGSQLLYNRGVAGNESVLLRFATENASYPEALQVDIGAGGTNSRSYTTASFRDTSAWYHVVLAVDTTQSTATDRFKLYVNGNLITDFASRNNPAEDFAMEVSSAKHRHGAYNDTDGFAGYCGYIAECHYIDGSQVAQTEFGEFDDDSGIWKPKQYTGSYGTGGYYLDFSDSSALGNNSAGDGTDFTLNNITAADQATDSPTNNFCTPLLIQPFSSTDTITHTEGGTKLTSGSGTGWRTNMASVSLSSGKWYFEAKHPGTIDGDAIMTSIVPTARFGNSGYASFYGGQSSGDGIGWYWDSRRFRYDDGSAISPPQNTVNSGDILGIALDMDNNYVYSRINGGAWHNNGSADGDPTSGSSGTGGFAVADEPHMICTSMYNPSKNIFVNYGGYNAFPVSSAASDANGHGVFEYAPPSGYFAICTKNLAEYG